MTAYPRTGGVWKVSREGLRRQVRWGLGAMPAFSEETISDEDLAALVAYLVWLRCLDGEDESG